MIYTKEELQHFEEVTLFFEHMFFIDCEYSFFTDDRLLDNDLKVSKNVYKDGKRRSMNLNSVSLDETKGAKMFDINTLRNFTTQLEECQGSRLNKFILKNWDTILTKKQKQFIVDSLNGKEKKYSRQQRSQFRQLIQKRLKDAFLRGGGNISVHKLVEYHYCVRFIEAFFERAGDKQELEGLIRREINKPFLNRIVYEVLNTQSRQDIVDFIIGKKESLEFKTLYALNNELIKVYTGLDFLECDIEKLIDMNMYK